MLVLPGVLPFQVRGVTRQPGQSEHRISLATVVVWEDCSVCSDDVLSLVQDLNLRVWLLEPQAAMSGLFLSEEARVLNERKQVLMVLFKPQGQLQS